MNELLTLKSNFVAPRYIEELGCDGLTAEEIALSLGTLVGDVRRKLREQPNETLKSLKLVISKKVNVNGLEYDEFFLSTAAARFFVARYESEMGDGYLAYLLSLESAFELLNNRMKSAGLTYNDVISILENNYALSQDRNRIEEKVHLLEADRETLLEAKKKLDAYESDVIKPITYFQLQSLDGFINKKIRGWGVKSKKKVYRMICWKFELLNESELPRNRLTECVDYVCSLSHWDVADWYEDPVARTAFEQHLRHRNSDS